VIGAGSSGIAALKALAERGMPVDFFEKSDRLPVRPRAQALETTAPRA
jgi:cation diffusion facilitator CzcD-associated flavoprotein CzcO